MSYLSTSASTMKLEGYIGDDPKDLRLQLFADADLCFRFSDLKKYEWAVPCLGWTPLIFPAHRSVQEADGR